MAVIKFGTKQINNPTPSGINLVARVLTVVGGIFLGWMQTSNFIGVYSQATISSILGLLLAIINGIAPLFGVNTTQVAIPTKDVSAMST